MDTLLDTLVLTDVDTLDEVDVETLELNDDDVEILVLALVEVEVDVDTLLDTLELNEVDVEVLMLMTRQDRIYFVSFFKLKSKGFFNVSPLRFDHLLLLLLLHHAESLTLSTLTLEKPFIYFL